jgi:predicted RNA-binding protein with PIN domain
MPYLVDGDNLLGTWPGRKRSDAERRTLAFELHRFASRARRRMVVVFDGSPPPGMQLGADVHFSGPGRSADQTILDFLRDVEDRRGWTVITSDRSLGDQCRYLEARIERCDRFRKRIQADASEEKPEQESDVDYWLEQFGGEPQD